MISESQNNFGVIFDVDGTMVHNTPYHRQAWVELCRRYGITLDNDSYHKKIHARSNDIIIRSLFGSDATPDFIRKIELEKETIYQDLFRPVLKEVPGLTALLKTLSESNISCAAASNSPKMNVDFVLDGLKIRHYFKTVIDRNSVRVGKPDPDILLKAASGIDLQPENCLLFEDSSSGFAAARNANMPYIAISTEPAEIGHAHDAKAVYKDFTEINIDTLEEFFC